jgi:Zn-finger nucleic acid-binding protein
MTACPKDGGQLQPYGQFGAFRCNSCSGLWLPYASVIRHIGKPAAKVALTGTEAPLKCPVDASPLVALNHRSVEVDLCQKCSGIWLDQGEIEHIVRKIQALPLVNVYRPRGSRSPDRMADDIADGSQIVLAALSIAAELFN